MESSGWNSSVFVVSMAREISAERDCDGFFGGEK
jgi:hypothetical protein